MSLPRLIDQLWCGWSLWTNVTFLAVVQTPFQKVNCDLNIKEMHTHKSWTHTHVYSNTATINHKTQPSCQDIKTSDTWKHAQSLRFFLFFERTTCLDLLPLCFPSPSRLILNMLELEKKRGENYDKVESLWNSLNERATDFSEGKESDKLRGHIPFMQPETALVFHSAAVKWRRHGFT